MSTVTFHEHLNKEDFERVKAIFGECVISQKFLDDFYADFTARSPEIRQMFAKTNMTAQKEVLRNGLSFLLMYAGGTQSAVNKIDALGASHSQKRINVRPNMYPMWVDALLATIKKHSKKFTPKDEPIWRRALQLGINRITSHYHD